MVFNKGKMLLKLKCVKGLSCGNINKLLKITLKGTGKFKGFVLIYNGITTTTTTTTTTVNKETFKLLFFSSPEHKVLM